MIDTPDLQCPTEGRKSFLRPIPAGWALDACASLDLGCPGFLRSLMGMRAVRRQAVFALAGMALTGRSERQLLDLDANRMLSLTTHELLSEAFQADPPTGLVGALRRIDGVLRRPMDYSDLFEVFATRSEHRRQIALAHCGPITSDRFEIIRALPDALVHPEFVRSVANRDRARFARAVLAAVRKLNPALTDDQIYEAVADLGPAIPLKGRLHCLSHLIHKTLPLPFDLDPDRLRHLRTKRDFEEAGSRTGTCVRSKFDVALSGKFAFVHVVHQDAIAVLVAVQDGWVLGRIHGPGNGKLTPEVVDAVRAEFTECGVRCWIPSQDPDLRPLALLHDPFDFYGLDDDAMDDLDNLL